MVWSWSFGRLAILPLAPHFRLVATPNEWGKKTTTIKQPLTERPEKYRAFFQSLIEALREQKFTNARNSRDRSWFSFSSGFSGTSYGAAFTATKQVRVGLYIDVGSDLENIELLNNLESQKGDIEEIVGSHLDWQRLENRRACRIALGRPGTIDDSTDRLLEIQEWLIEYLFKFKKAFHPRLSELIG